MKRLKFKIIIFCLVFFEIFGLAKISFALVLFEDSFNSQADWTLQQYNLGQHPYGVPTACYTADCSLPANWNTYYNGDSFCNNSGGPGNNTLNINNASPRGGSGKSLQFWDESCDPNWQSLMQDSDGSLGKDLGAAYPEIYFRYFIRFQPGFQWRNNGETGAHKLAHIQNWAPGTTPYSYFGQTTTNQPVTVPGFHAYGGHIWYYTAYRCEVSYYCQGTPSYNSDVGTDMDHVDLGPISILLDGQWHAMEFYYKMNTNNGATFNKDGEHKFWLDGVLRYDSTTHNGGQGIPWSDNGSVQSPRRGWRIVSVGGNNNNRWTESCTGTGCEQYYAVDDLVVSTTYIGPNYVIGSAPPPSDSQTPTNPSNLSASAVSSSQINLSWTASTDNVGVTGYRIYRGGALIGTSATNSYSNSGLSANTTYSYYVIAYDAAGNTSGQSNTTSATTQAVSPPPPPPPTGTGLVAAYSFDQSSGATLTDSSGNNYTGTLTNGPVWATGQFNNALSFDGTNDYVSFSPLTFSGPFTLSFWYNDFSTAVGHLVSGNVQYGPKLYDNGNNFFFRAVADADTTVPKGAQNTWHFVAIVRDADNKVDMYIDTNNAVRLFSDVAQIGNFSFARLGSDEANLANWYGAIDNLRLYSRALSSAEIQADRTAAIGALPDTTPPASPTGLTVV